jgi:hypothetical protein
MSKVFSVMVGLVVAATAAQAALAQDSATGQRIVVQERATGISGTTPRATGTTIASQEHGRRADRRLFEPSSGTPILVAGSPDGFDVADAGIGGAAVLALALAIGAGVALRAGSRRGRAAEAPSGGS